MSGFYANPSLAGGALSGPGPGIPSPVFLDTFTDVAGTALPAHTPDVGVQWVQVGANLVIRDGGYCEANGSGTGAGNPTYHSNILLGTANPPDPERVSWRFSKSNGGTSLVQGVTLFSDVNGNNKVTFGLVDRSIRIQTWQGGQIATTETIKTLVENPPDFATPLDHSFSLVFTGREVTFEYGPLLDPEFSVTRDYSDLTGLGTAVGFILRAAGCRLFDIAYGGEGVAAQGANPPDSHSVDFLSTNAVPIWDPALSAYRWRFNTYGESGRGFLSHNLRSVYGTQLEVGKAYELSYDYDNSAISYGAALSGIGVSNVTVLSQQRGVAAGGSGKLFVRFRIDDADYGITVRVGNGTTANNTAQFDIFNPSLIQVPSGAPGEGASAGCQPSTHRGASTHDTWVAQPPLEDPIEDPL